jgi:hypothetical protein
VLPSVALSTFPAAKVGAASILVELLFVLPLGTQSEPIGHDWMTSDTSGGRGTRFLLGMKNVLRKGGRTDHSSRFLDAGMIARKNTLKTTQQHRRLASSLFSQVCPTVACHWPALACGLLLQAARRCKKAEKGPVVARQTHTHENPQLWRTCLDKNNVHHASLFSTFLIGRVFFRARKPCLSSKDERLFHLSSKDERLFHLSSEDERLFHLSSKDER